MQSIPPLLHSVMPGMHQALMCRFEVSPLGAEVGGLQ